MASTLISNATPTAPLSTDMIPMARVGDATARRIAVNDIVPVFNVSWYGGALDGTTDDSTAFAAAVAAANTAGGGTVVWDGTMAVGSVGWVGLTLTSLTDVTLLGLSKQAGIKCLAVPSQGLTGLTSVKTLLKLYQCTRVRVENIFIDVNSLLALGVGMDACSYCEIIGNRITGTLGSVNAMGIKSLAGGTFNVFEHNLVHNIDGVGISVGGTNVGHQEEDARIAHNIVRDTGGTAIASVMLRGIIIGNHCLDAGGSGIVVAGHNSEIDQHVTVMGNVCKGNTYHGIQSDVTTPGYTKNITVTGNVCVANTSAGVYAVNCEDWIITGNVLEGNAKGITTGAPYAKRITIVGNGIYNNSTNGIDIAAQAVAGSADTIVVSGNTVVDNGVNIYINESGGTGIDISVTGNVSTDGTYGLFLTDGFSNVLVANNIFTDNSTVDVRNNNTTDGVSFSHNIFTTSTGDINTIRELLQEGNVDFVGTMANSSKDPTTDAPADWVQVDIGGATYYLPAYAA